MKKFFWSMFVLIEVMVFLVCARRNIYHPAGFGIMFAVFLAFVAIYFWLFPEREEGLDENGDGGGGVSQLLHSMEVQAEGAGNPSREEEEINLSKEIDDFCRDVDGGEGFLEREEK